MKCWRSKVIFTFLVVYCLDGVRGSALVWSANPSSFKTSLSLTTDEIFEKIWISLLKRSRVGNIIAILFNRQCAVDHRFHFIGYLGMRREKPHRLR